VVDLCTFGKGLMRNHNSFARGVNRSRKRPRMPLGSSGGTMSGSVDQPWPTWVLLIVGKKKAMRAGH